MENEMQTSTENSESSGLISRSRAVIMTVGAMIGSAIFTLSGVTIASSGWFSLLSWAIAALILLGYGYLTVILAEKWTKTGGMFLFPALSLFSSVKMKAKVGFYSAWIYFFGCFAGVIFAALYTGFNFATLFSIFGINVQPEIFGVLSILTALLINLRNWGQKSKIQSILTIVLILCLAVFIVYIWFFSGSASFSKVFSEGEVSQMFSGIPIAMLAYGSIIVPAFFADKIVDAKKSIRKVVFKSMGIVVSIYLLVILSVLAVCNMSYFANDPASVYSPLVSAIQNASRLSLSSVSPLTIVVTVGAILALFTTQVVVLNLAVTSLTVTAENFQLPKFFKNENETTILVSVLAILLLFVSEGPDSFINLGALFNAAFIILICISVSELLRKDKNSDYTLETIAGIRILALVVAVAVAICSVFEIINGGLKLVAFSLFYLAIGWILNITVKNKK